MGFKKLTNTGIEFIETVCSGSGNDLLRGSNRYPLIFSNDPANTTYIARPEDPFNNDGSLILTNKQLGRALIKWFNDYSEEYELDANIIAAQAYVESNYRLWAFPNNVIGSSEQGISQILSSTLYDIIIGNNAPAGYVSNLFTNDEIDRITNGLTNPRNLNSYKYTDNPNLDVAINNRVPLFQNCMDNPDLMIKAQCRYVKGISVKAANNAASTLFGYNQGFGYVGNTWTSTLKRAEPDSLAEANYKEGIQYVNKIFRVLGDKNQGQFKPSGVWFGYDIDFTFDTFEADVKSSGSDINLIDKSTRLSKNYKLADLITTSQAQVNVPSQEEFEKLKLFANDVLEPINDLIGKVLRINSSFRSDAVNSAVGGVITSQHRLAEAADVRVDGGDPRELAEIYDTIITSTNPKIPFDQIIFEAKRWIHISHKSKNPSKNRRQPLVADRVDNRWVYRPYSGNIFDII